MSAARQERSSTRLAFVVVVLLLTLVATGAGLTVGSLLKSGESALGASQTGGSIAEHAVARAEEGHGPASHGQGGAVISSTGNEENHDPEKLRVVRFPPVLTTLADPKGTWIRLEGSMVVVEETDESAEVLVEKAATQVLAYLRTTGLRQIEGPSGLLYLRQDLNDVIAALSGGQIREVLIHSLVVE